MTYVISTAYLISESTPKKGLKFCPLGSPFYFDTALRGLFLFILRIDARTQEVTLLLFQYKLLRLGKITGGEAGEVDSRGQSRGIKRNLVHSCCLPFIDQGGNNSALLVIDLDLDISTNEHLEADQGL